MVGGQDGCAFGGDVVEPLDPGPEQELEHRSQNERLHEPIKHVAYLSGEASDRPSVGSGQAFNATLL